MPKQGSGGTVIELLANQDERPNSVATIKLHVERQVDDSYGVFADELLLAYHDNQAAALAHCERLLIQQAADLVEY